MSESKGSTVPRTAVGQRLQGVDCVGLP
jgi:hypothetical protein